MNESPWIISCQDSKSDRAQEAQRRSQTIPMPRSHVPRTKSEVQLHEDTAAAEWRDLCMFYRVVHGIRERQSSNSPFDGDNDGFQIDANQSIENMMMARHDAQKPLDTEMSYDPSNEHDLSQCYRQQPGGAFGQHIMAPPLALETPPDNHDGWSISGYEEMDPSYKIGPVVEADDAEDDGVFSMEL